MATDNSRKITQLGYNPSITSATSLAAPQDFWPGGGAYPWMSSATSLEIVSASANDTAAGTGARTVAISGLDASFNPVIQVITLNGTTAVAIPTQLLRINSAVVASAGSGGVNAGNLTIRVSGGGATRGIVLAGYGTLRQSQYTVPAGFSLKITSYTASIINPTATLDMTIATYQGNPLTGSYALGVEVSPSLTAIQLLATNGLLIPEKSDFGFRATAASATLMMTAGWSGVLIKN